MAMTKIPIRDLGTGIVCTHWYKFIAYVVKNRGNDECSLNQSIDLVLESFGGVRETKVEGNTFMYSHIKFETEEQASFFLLRFS